MSGQFVSDILAMPVLVNVVPHGQTKDGPGWYEIVGLDSSWRVPHNYRACGNKAHSIFMRQESANLIFRCFNRNREMHEIKISFPDRASTPTYILGPEFITTRNTCAIAWGNEKRIGHAAVVDIDSATTKQYALQQEPSHLYCSTTGSYEVVWQDGGHAFVSAIPSVATSIPLGPCGVDVAQLAICGEQSHLVRSEWGPQQTISVREIGSLDWKVIGNALIESEFACNTSKHSQVSWWEIVDGRISMRHYSAQTSGIRTLLSIPDASVDPAPTKPVWSKDGRYVVSSYYNERLCTSELIFYDLMDMTYTISKLDGVISNAILLN